jgi:hypothetical protein
MLRAQTDAIVYVESLAAWGECLDERQRLIWLQVLIVELCEELDNHGRDSYRVLQDLATTYNRVQAIWKRGILATDRNRDL